MGEMPLHLSERARARMRADLPGLLGALRRRRRRRAAARAAFAFAVVALGALAVLRPWRARPAPRPEPPRPAPVWTIVRDDPSVVDRHLVRTVRRDEWFVDDAGLQALLRGAERPEGLVRTRGQVLVSAEAIDPFPTLSP